jgi:hypothetical protein
VIIKVEETDCSKHEDATAVRTVTTPTLFPGHLSYGARYVGGLTLPLTLPDMLARIEYFPDVLIFAGECDFRTAI